MIPIGRRWRAALAAVPPARPAWRFPAAGIRSPSSSSCTPPAGGSRAVTVDHGLRAESAAEAAAVAALCAGRGIPHDVLRWEGWDGRGNLQDQARQARRRLIAAWARGRGISAVALGHTLDDQAETLVMRLARGSGVDGLSGMLPVAEAEGIRWLRPLLGTRRAALRAWLEAQGVAWAEDPSNADARFDRVRARLALPVLAGLGIGPERLAATARAMARARAALERATADLARLCLADGGAGDLLLDPQPFAAGAEEVRLRLLSAALSWVSGAVYRPRLVRLEAALAAVEGGGVGHGLTLHGCVLRTRGGRVAIRRELARMAAAVPLAAGRWDGRWEIEGTPPRRPRPQHRRPRRRRPGAAPRPPPGTGARGAGGDAGDLARRRAHGGAGGAAGGGLRLSAGLCRHPALGAGDSALNPPRQGLC